jgi:hypothetical protein
MRKLLVVSTLVTTSALSSVSIAAVKRVSYPEVKVKVESAYKPDAAFAAMQDAMAQAVAKKESDALFALVAPTFVWTVQGQLAGDLDLGRNRLHNFKVVFGFRSHGADMDGGVENGPFWDTLAALAEDGSFYQSGESGNLVCSPAAAEVADESTFEQAHKKIANGQEEAEWYFTLTATGVTKSPNDSGRPVANVRDVALPVLSVYPTTEGNASSPPTHFEVLLPSGTSGWVPVSAVRPLVTDRLCYAKSPNGDWRIAIYDQAE